MWVYAIFSEPNFIETSKHYWAHYTYYCLWKQKLMELHVLFFNRNFKSQNWESVWNPQYYCTCYSINHNLLSNLFVFTTGIQYFLWIIRCWIIFLTLFFLINFLILIIFLVNRAAGSILFIISEIRISNGQVLVLELKSGLIILITIQEIIIIFSQKNLLIFIELILTFFIYLLIFYVIDNTFRFHFM